MQKNGYCDASLCHQKYRFQWHGRRPCQSNFVCTSLSGNVCGDFGVKLLYGRINASSLGGREEADRVADVCRERTVYEAEVADGHSLEIRLWYRDDAEFRAECFVWCTAEGALPQAERRPEADPEAVRDIVSL